MTFINFTYENITSLTPTQDQLIEWCKSAHASILNEYLYDAFVLIAITYAFNFVVTNTNILRFIAEKTEIPYDMLEMHYFWYAVPFIDFIRFVVVVWLIVVLRMGA